MSKLLKELVTDHLRSELDGVQDMILVDVVGLTSNRAMALRKTLRDSNIHLMVIKNSLAKRATEGTQLAAAFEGAKGTLAMVWGGSDIVALAKIVTKLAADKEYEKLHARGGVMGGVRLAADEVLKVSKWPSREEQLSMLAGQILGPGGRLAGQLGGPGGALVSQVKQKAEGDDAAAGAEAAPAAEAAPEAAG